MTTTTEPIRYPRAAVIPVVKQLVEALRPHCSRIIVAGSLRRLKPTVKDIEILFVPKLETPASTDLFKPADPIPATDAAIDRLLFFKTLAKRQNVNGSEMWGPKNKLAIHVPSGIPVDLFAATEENWWNYLVCRTGGADNNREIAMTAQRKGWQWNPYGPGFTPVMPDGRTRDYSRESHTVTSEQDVFTFLGLPYLEPKDRP
jgi:DNA polymerase/3'-5' exonuclease PolX